MKKLLILAGSVLAVAGAAYAGPKHDHGYDLYVIADEVTNSAIYVVTHAKDATAIEVFDNDKVQWMKDGAALKAIAKAQNLFGPAEAARERALSSRLKTMMCALHSRCCFSNTLPFMPMTIVARR
ncbi:MAG: hypothetical protein Q9M33_08910 [Robiginitomaculum sp.]|nr:hypothetical protein [Robiginitomaculum sp.]MDQ7076443.1 hypothetical protein [Robiginitomaculum sp.]